MTVDYVRDEVADRLMERFLVRTVFTAYQSVVSRLVPGH